MSEDGASLFDYLVPAAPTVAPEVKGTRKVEKAPDALRTIGEVAAALGIRQHVLRYWEEQFPMLKPLKRSGGRRYYRTEDVALVETIDRLVHREGYTLKGAKAVLTGKPDKPQDAPVAMAANTPAAGSDRERLAAIRDRLSAALAADA